MRKKMVIVVVLLLLLVSLVSWVVLNYLVIRPPDGELRVKTTEYIGHVRELVGANDYGPDVTGLYEDQVAYDLFQDLGLQRLRVWCRFGTQLAEGLGWGWHHTIFNGSSLADAQNPQFYNWTYLDLLFEVVNQTGAQPILTFTGCPRSLAQGGMPNMPPQDLGLYAEVVAHVVMHYLQGWPDMTGLIYPIDYVEIGNEPNFAPFWLGTMQEFLNLYSVVSQRLAQVAGTFKIGGPGLADINLSLWMNSFLTTVNDQGLPLDFFSWHAYYDDATQVVQTIETGKALLLAREFDACECVFDEWGQDLFDDEGWNTIQAAMHATDVLIGAAKQSIDIACFTITKDAPLHPDVVSPYEEVANFGLLTRNPTTPKPTFHALKPFIALVASPFVLNAALPLPTTLGAKPLPLTYLATRIPRHDNYTLLVVNHGIQVIRCRITLEGAPLGIYRVETSELSNSSITQHNGWSPPVIAIPPNREEPTDIIINFPPQSILWITIQYIGPPSSISVTPYPIIQLFVCSLVPTSKKAANSYS